MFRLAERIDIFIVNSRAQLNFLRRYLNIPGSRIRFISYSIFLQLYRDADLVVVSLKENSYAAGVTSLLKAMACRRTIVATPTEGLADYLSDEDAIITVKPGDTIGLQQAILHLLNNPEEAEACAQRAYQLVRERYSLENYVEMLAQYLESVVLET